MDLDLQAEHTISAEHVQAFIFSFYKYDVLHSGLIDIADVRKVVEDIPPPLGRKPSALWMRILEHELQTMPLRVSNKVRVGQPVLYLFRLMV